MLRKLSIARVADSRLLIPSKELVTELYRFIYRHVLKSRKSEELFFKNRSRGNSLRPADEAWGGGGNLSPSGNPERGLGSRRAGGAP